MNAFEIPGVVSIQSGRGGLKKLDVRSPWSTAEIYLNGAHVTAFQKSGEAPLLFLSRGSSFEAGKAIRGGVPICYPWFGPRDGDVAHGFARVTEWKLNATQETAEGIEIRLGLPDTPAKSRWPACSTEFVVTVGRALKMELVTRNLSDRVLEFEECLHTYLAVNGAAAISITGLESAFYLDKTDGGKRKQEGAEPIRIQRETNRVYVDTTNAVEVIDPGNGRRIRVEKSGSNSTVLWNPWTTQLLSDMAVEEHANMVCVESGNVGPNKSSLQPGSSTVLKATISSHSLS